MNPYDTTGAATCICICMHMHRCHVTGISIYIIYTFIRHIISYHITPSHVISNHIILMYSRQIVWGINDASIWLHITLDSVLQNPIIQKQHKTTPSARQKYVFLCPWISHGPQKLCSIGLSERHTTMGQHKSRKSITSMWRAISSAICLDLNQQSCSKANKQRQTLSKILPQPAQRVKDL